MSKPASLHRPAIRGNELTAVMRFVLALIFGLFSASIALADVSGVDKPRLNHIGLVISTIGATPYPQEMVLLKMRTILFKTEVSEQEVEQPSLENFSWAQLGSDRSYRTLVDRAPAIVFERLLALYPVKSGKLVIDPFVHHLTLVDSNNVETEGPRPPLGASLRRCRPMDRAAGGPAEIKWLPASSPFGNRRMETGT